VPKRDSSRTSQTGIQPPSSTPMTRGRALSNDLRGAIVNMAWSLDIDSIVQYTGCKRRTVERILSDYRKNGTTTRICLSKELRGAKRALRSADVEVCLQFHSELSAIFTQQPSQFLQGQVHFSPDIYLTELRELLEERRGIEVSDSTLWRSLKRSGFTMKKVGSQASHLLYDELCNDSTNELSTAHT
jgi:transposase